MMQGFDANNRIVSGTGVTYDAAGNTTNDGTTGYTYDAENRIITASNNVSGASSYVYDANGQRVQKTTVAGGTVSFLYDLAGHEVNEISSTGAWNRGEVYAGGRHLATYKGGTSGTTYFIHADWLGTERVRTTNAGASCETVTSLPFGDAEATSGSCGDPSPMHFTGKERDTETGLDDFGARFYSSSLGRFSIPDWAGAPTDVPYAEFGNPQSLNLYSYVKNNPLNATDPDGHDVTFADTKLEQQAASIAGQSQTFSNELELAQDDPSIDVKVVERGLKQNAQGSKADTTVSTTDDNGITHVTIFVDPYWTSDDQYEHEWGHEKDARTQGGTQFVKNAQADVKKYPGKSQHGDRPTEKSADKFKDTVNKERKQARNAENERKKKEKEEREREKKRKKDVKSV